MSRLSRGWILVAVAALALGAGCARSPEAKKNRHLARGDKYFNNKQYREALIEYQNVLRIEPTNSRAIQRVGLSYHSVGDLRQAFPYLYKARQLDPTDENVTLKLASVYLVSGKPEEARSLATGVWEKDGKQLEALQILAASARTPEEIDGVIQRFEAARAQLGVLAKFHIVLADLLWRRRDRGAAERELREALAREPKSVLAHLASANFYFATGNLSAAETELKAAVDIDPLEAGARLKLADFYLLTRKFDAMKVLLEGVTPKSADYGLAQRRLVELALVQGRPDDALKIIDELFKKAPSDIDGRMLRGRAQLAKRQPTEAIQEFQAVLRLEPKLPTAHYYLALAQLEAGAFQQAKSELALALENAPQYVEATLLLAQLNVDSGNTAPAIEALEKLTAARPGMLQAYVFLGTAYLKRREPAKATEAFKKILTIAPKDPRGPYLVGVSLKAQGKAAEAASQFEHALALAPEFVEPLAELVMLAFADKQPERALERVNKQVALEPKSAKIQTLLGLVHRARKDSAAAEAAYSKAAELDPTFVTPYVELGRLYVETGKDEQALHKFEQALAVRSDNVVARMLAAEIYMHRNETAKAKEAYEKVLAANPRFAAAANNLAWLLFREGSNKDRALQLAQTAKEAAPDDPNVSDTLGWILYNRGVYERALALLRDSASKLPQNPEVQYHAGMAFRHGGDRDAARTALGVAVASAADFPGKDEARKALTELK